MNHNHEKWMKYAIKLAKNAFIEKEIPIGAVLILNNKIIGEGWNQCIKNNDPTAHAEIIALRQGGKKIANYRMLNTILYVTLEPCLMCIGAIIHARIFHLVCGAYKKKNKLIKVVKNSNIIKYNNHSVIFTYGILSQKCSDQIINFFINKRKDKINKNL
ncbi:MAG: tRNA adenosine(34) deaminase TadA [Enterobacterales bacterium]